MPKFSTPEYASLPLNVDFFYAKEVAAYLRCSLQTVYNLIEDGSLKAHWLRGCYRIRRTDLHLYFLAAFGDSILETETKQPPPPFPRSAAQAPSPSLNREFPPTTGKLRMGN